VATLVVIIGGLLTIFQMTKVNEIEELKNKKINSSLIAAALIIGISFIVSDYCGLLCEALIPYPEVLQIH
jgi:pyridoxine 5'-phosphate synthase PdxJ